MNNDTFPQHLEEERGPWSHIPEMIIDIFYVVNDESVHYCFSNNWLFIDQITYIYELNLSPWFSSFIIASSLLIF